MSELGWRFLVCVAALMVIVYGVWQLRLILLPVFIAILAATILGPPAMWLRRKGVRPTLATALVYIAGLAVLFGVGWLIVPSAIHEFDELATQVGDGLDEVGDWVGSGPLGISEADIQEAIDEVNARVQESADDIATGVYSGALLAVQALAGILITMVITFFLVRDGDRMWDWFVRLFPDHRQRTMHVVGEEGWRVLSAFVRGITLIATIDAIGIGLALWIIGVPLIMPLAILTFVLAFIPFIGAIVAGAAAALVALVSEGPLSAGLVIGAVILVQQLEGDLLYPLIVGRNVELHPVVILVCVGAGGILGGIIGAFLAVPVAAVIATVVPIVRRQTAISHALEPPP
ncbi:MAG: AI-2E family transporter [Solirubrobacteraceae bacterium]|nr:AI-2E family transporter [Solirubrobacteraceae bacterium]